MTSKPFTLSTIIKSIGKCLNDNFERDVDFKAIYIGRVPDNFKEPSFCIKLLNTSKTPLLKDRFILNVSLDIQYFLEQSYDMDYTISDVLLKLSKVLDILPLTYSDLQEDGKLKAFDVNTKIIDDVGHFLVEYKIVLNSDNDLSEIVMEKVEQEVGVQNG